MKKGFTMIELIAVIGLLAILAVVFVPSVIKTVSSNGDKVYAIKEKQIKEAASSYADYDTSFVKPSSDTKYIKLSTLISGNYISKVVDNDGNDTCKGYVAVTNNSISGYDFDVCLICDGYKTNSTTCTNDIYNSLG